MYINKVIRNGKIGKTNVNFTVHIVQYIHGKLKKWSEDLKKHWNIVL